VLGRPPPCTGFAGALGRTAERRTLLALEPSGGHPMGPASEAVVRRRRRTLSQPARTLMGSRPRRPSRRAAPHPRRVSNPYSPERANGHAWGCGIVGFDGISGGMVGGTPAGSFGGGMLFGAGDGTPTGSGPGVSAGRGGWVGAGLGSAGLGSG